MEQRDLGQSGVKVSAVGLGCMMFGGQSSREDAFAQLDMAFEAGITLFDAAENYPAPPAAETQGRTEEILGEWIAERGVRDKVVIATKVTGRWGMEWIRGKDRRLDRANIVAAIEGNLRRLKTDYIDLYQPHWPDRPITAWRTPRYTHIPDNAKVTPIEETYSVLSDLVAAGKIRQVGVCNESPWGMMRYLSLAQAGGGPRVVSYQNGYSLLDRTFELGNAEVAMREQVGLLAYSPLASGLLTGKHEDPARPEPNSRLSFDGMKERYEKPRLRETLRAYVDLARRNGMEPANMALAFVRDRPFVTAVLMAASSLPQLHRNLTSLDVTLSPETLKEIDEIHDQNPNPIW